MEAKNDYDSKFVPLLRLPGSQTMVSEPCAFCSIFMFMTVVRKMLFVSVCCKGNLVLNVTEELSDVEPEDCMRGEVKTAWVVDALGCLRRFLSREREGWVLVWKGMAGMCGKAWCLHIVSGSFQAPSVQTGDKVVWNHLLSHRLHI